MATIRSTIAQESGIPLGGLGTGSVEIRADGYFHEWQIFNIGAWAPQQPACCGSRPQPNLGPNAFAFFLRVEEAGAPPLMRRLGLRMDQHNLYSFAWLKSVQAIEFTGRYPVATLRYLDDDLPVSVTATLFSPFIPHDARTSGTPGFHVVFTLRNRTDRPLKVALLATLRNPLACGETDRQLENSVTQADGTTYLTMRTAAHGTCNPTLGSLGLSVTGGEASWITGEFEGYFGGYIFCGHPWGTTPYGMSHESLFHGFRDSGRLPSLSAERSPAMLLPLDKAAIGKMTDAQMRKALRQLLEVPFVRVLWDRVRAVDPAVVAGRAGLIEFLTDMHGRITVLAGEKRERQTWGDAALATSVDLAPAAEQEVRFTLGWHFPLHYSQKGPVLGHVYEHWFEDAEAVNRFLVAGAAHQQAQTCAFAETLFDTTLDPELPDAWSGQLSTLAKCTWWTKDGNFAVWEGLGCCGFHTTDITYQGSFNLLALFPELQQRQMEMGAEFQRADGRVHHFFTPDFSQVDEGFDRVDMNPQFVLLVCRDYLWTGDRAYLERLWPHILQAMENSAELDADGDGLPDHDTRRNTYDAWNFFGTPSYIASLWLASLRAASRIAADLGHAKQATAWRKLLDKGVASFERKLWNGEYYSLWVDGAQRDECCMSDQIDGEWFSTLIGLGSSLPRPRIVAALDAILKYNYNDQDGLINANYPPGKPPRLTTLRNLQQTAPWTGIEYAIASMLFDFGRPAAAQSVIKTIHERYLRAGRFWNHVECGDHYYRAMSSWAVLLGATGFKVDVPRTTVTFAPAVALAEFRAPWVAATGWGRFTQNGPRFTLECRAGSLGFQTLVLTVPCAGQKVRINGKTVPARLVAKDGRTEIVFAKPVTLKADESLAVGPA